MAEIVEREVLPSSSENQSEIERKEDPAEPEAKRRKLYKNDETPSDKLEHRLGGILCCAVCLDLPRAAVYQCSNGHLMCAGCFTHVLADARLRDESATCPNCRIEISKTSASRNLAVEKAISELPSECQFCSKEFPRHSLDHHEDSQCDDRIYQIVVNSRNPGSFTFLAGLVYLAMFFYWILTAIFRNESIFNSTLSGRMNTDIRITGCKFSCIGCPWKGPFHERVEHEAACAHPLKTGSEVMEALEVKEKVRLEEATLYNHVFELLSFEKIMFNDLQLKPYRTDEFVNKLYYETSRFTAFSHQWVVKANINNSQRDPTQSNEREISYQLILRNKSTIPMSIQYIALKGPFGDARIAPQVHAYTFCCEKDDSAAQMEAIPAKLPLPDARETNRLLANKAINFRLIMFLASK